MRKKYEAPQMTTCRLALSFMLAISRPEDGDRLRWRMNDIDEEFDEDDRIA